MLMGPQRLPAITFEKTRLKRLGWEQWRRAMAWRRVQKEAAAPRERRLLGTLFLDPLSALRSSSENAFATWKEASRQKAAVRSA